MSTLPIVVASLKIGMFVAKLDRPWSETPFLTEGFLVVEADQLQVLRSYCQRVYIDPLRSSPESLSHLGDLRGKHHAADWDSDHAFELILQRLFPEWKKKHGGPSKLGGAIARARHFIDQRVLAGIGQQRVRRASSRVKGMPPGTVLYTYRNTRSAKGEMRRARPLFLHTEIVLLAAIDTARAMQPVEMGPLVLAARGLAQSVIANPQPLLWLSWIRALGNQVTDHAMKSAIQLLVFGRSMGLGQDDLEQIGIIGLLFDIGKARVDTGLLQKREALSSEELAKVREHVQLGLEALGGADRVPAAIYRGIAEHHERMDGSGYPAHLKADAIGLFGRMAGIVDTFATLTARRSYAPAMSSFDALKVIYSGTDSGFPRDLVEEFVLAMGIFPVGSLIELSSGEIAVVLRQIPQHQLAPRILVLTSSDKLPRKASVVDLLAHPVDRNEQRLRITRGLPLGAYGLDPRRFQLG